MPQPGRHSSSPSQERRDQPAPVRHGRRKDLYVLSGDDGLLLELGPLLGDRYRARPIDSADQIDAASANPWLLIIDATARHDARAQAARLEQQHPLAPLLIICADGRSVDWASALARGMVGAVVERSALALTLSAALATTELRMNAAAEATTSNVLAKFSGPDRPAGHRLWLWAGLTLLAAAAGAWFYLSARPSGPTTSVTQPPAAMPAGVVQAPPAVAAPTSPQRTVLELLSDARIAFREEGTMFPAADGGPHGESALELYGAVLAQDAQNEEARDGMERLLVVARARVQSDLAAGKPEEAARLLESFRNAGLAADALAGLQADIAAARLRNLPAQARAALASGDTDLANQLIAQFAAAGGARATISELRHAVETRNAAAQMAALAAQARTAISTGALLDPEGANARTLVQNMVQLDRTDPLVPALQHELQAALLARAQSASHNAQFDLAQQLLSAASDYGNTKELANARRQVQSDLDAARERTAAAAAELAAAPPATPSPAAEPAYLRAKPLAPLTAVFPAPALQSGQAGYAIVEFMLDNRGRASKAAVVESSPPGVFDAAAMTAVLGGRYDTTAFGNSEKPRRARIRISFKPQP